MFQKPLSTIGYSVVLSAARGCVSAKCDVQVLLLERIPWSMSIAESNLLVRFVLELE